MSEPESLVMRHTNGDTQILEAPFDGLVALMVAGYRKIESEPPAAPAEETEYER